MNFSDINTPAELLAMNEQKPATVESILEQVNELQTYQEGVKLAYLIISKLAVYHQQSAQEFAQDEGERAILWAADEGRLHMALLALQHITLD